MLLVSPPLRQAQCRLWSDCVGAFPFLTVLAPSPKTNESNGQRHKTSIDWVGQMMGVVRRWLRQ